MQIGNPYQLKNDDFIRFGVKKNPEPKEPYLIEKIFTQKDYDMKEGYIYIYFTPNDTNNISYGTYTYDIGIQNGIDYYYIIDPCKFTIAKRVTEWSDDDE